MILAVTGGTGFVGRHVIEQALAAGHDIRALTRRPQPDRTGLTWIVGDLARPGELCAGADAVLHIAGAVNAADRAGFAAANVTGTQTIIDAARCAGSARFVHVSSFAAREPQLSAYGWSKYEAERAVMDSDRDWTIVRPPAVYGPGDLELRDVFRLARLGVALLPPPGRFSLVHVDDLARLLLACAEQDVGRVVLEAEDAGGGISHADFARAVGAAVGRRVVPLHLPRALLLLAAVADGRLRGAGAKLTRDRVGYLAHPDWTAERARRPPAGLWQPRIPLATGLAETAAWYRDNGLL